MLVCKAKMMIRSQKQWWQRDIIPKTGNCWNCNIPGHYARNCRKRGGRGGRGGKRNNNNASKANVVMIARRVTSSRAFATVTKPLDTLTMYIDSAASRHMCITREVYMNINNLEQPTSVQVANGETISVGGVGSIKLKNDLAQVEFRNC